ncbi:precorrin-6x reductase [Methylobacterium sp. 4-46]|uniref:cobalt-precorrin-6A reductase n=1 Tax=unclassified Methylobacterium TaxID=2615210 RepID=UPI000152C121|nr:MULTISPECIES: cobalt-precorrin-6A reductase [Methylobacterium]ACA16898.1 precorrin-6x reductase [Methylobacterium sp. 4-46]WFT82588.1 cobalt-precorrin-6A reductase [Methylobacterium nodulans]
MRILLLGGTTEATGLARRLAEDPSLRPTLSLAGRTAAPAAAPVATRIGGFGGAEGLAAWLRAEGVDAVIDATHPFAQVISRNAAEACARTGTPLLALRRPPWAAVAGDAWHEVETVAQAVPALGETPRRVFLTVGRLELAAFAAAPQHAYLVRTIEPVGDALPVADLTAITARGPFAEAEERDLMRRHRVEVLVTKNSGGTATYGKIAAARSLGLPVVIVRQPPLPAVARVATQAEALAWLRNHRAASTLRGV